MPAAVISAASTATITTASAAMSAIALVITVPVTITMEAMSAPAVAIPIAPPRTDADENPVIEKFRAVEAVGCTFVWLIIVVAIFTDGWDAYIAAANDDADLSLRENSTPHKHRQNYEKRSKKVTHFVTPLS